MKQYISAEQIQKEINACLQKKPKEEGPNQIDLTKNFEREVQQDLSYKHQYKLEKYQVPKTAEHIFNRKKEKNQDSTHEMRYASAKQFEGLAQLEENQNEVQQQQQLINENQEINKQKPKIEDIMQDPEFQQVYKVYPDNITKNILLYMPQNETNSNKFQPRGNKERLQEIKDINKQIRKLQKNILKEYEAMFKEQDEQQQQQPPDFEFVTNIPGQNQEELEGNEEQEVDEKNEETELQQQQQEQEKIVTLQRPMKRLPFKKKKEKIFLNLEELKKQQFQNICIATTTNKVPLKGRAMNSVEHLQRVYNKENTKIFPYNCIQQFKVKKLPEQNLLQIYMKNQKTFLQGAFNYLPKSIQFYTKKHMLKMQQSNIINQQLADQLSPEQIQLLQEQNLSSNQTESNDQHQDEIQQQQQVSIQGSQTIPYSKQSFQIQQKQIEKEFKNVIFQNNHKNGLQYKMDKLLASSSARKKITLPKTKQT